jgi:hypothetical protein
MDSAVCKGRTTAVKWYSDWAYFLALTTVSTQLLIHITGQFFYLYIKLSPLLGYSFDARVGVKLNPRMSCRPE